MKDITFKVKDNKLHILIDDSLTNNEFLSILKDKLERLLVLNDSSNKEVILSMANRSLNNREILQLFDILNEVEIFFLSKVICKNKNKESLMIYKGSFHAGQIRFFENSALIVGNINKGSKVIIHGDLYVLGKINGDIELKDDKGKIYCECINNSLVKIGAVYKLYSEELNSKEIYLNDNKIIERDYKKGEINNVKSDSCYIW